MLPNPLPPTVHTDTRTTLLAYAICNWSCLCVLSGSPADSPFMWPIMSLLVFHCLVAIKFCQFQLQEHKVKFSVEFLQSLSGIKIVKNVSKWWVHVFIFKILFLPTKRFWSLIYKFNTFLMFRIAAQGSNFILHTTHECIKCRGSNWSCSKWSWTRWWLCSPRCWYPGPRVQLGLAVALTW